MKNGPIKKETEFDMILPYLDKLSALSAHANVATVDDGRIRHGDLAVRADTQAEGIAGSHETGRLWNITYFI